MGGGLMGLKHFMYHKQIINKEKINSGFISNDTNKYNDKLDHISTICYILQTNENEFNKEHFIHAIKEIHNNVKILLNKETENSEE